MEKMLVFSSILVWIGLLLNFLLTFALVRRVNLMTKMSRPSLGSDGLEVGQLAPHFIAHTLQGKTVSMEDYKGNSLLLLFVGPYCEFCRDSMFTYKEYYEMAKEAGTKFTMVCDASIEETRSFVDELDINIPILSAASKENTFLKDYKVNSVPIYCFINQQGIVHSFGIPSFDFGELENILKEEVML